MNSVYKNRSGVTIIEVLFAIAIVIMGLMGIAGLIMIAGTQLTQGIKADGMSNLALNAVQEFDIHHLRQQDRLAVAVKEEEGGGIKFSPFRTDGSYCIDPYHISHQVLDNNPNVEQLSHFPGIAIPAGNPTQIEIMPRVTIFDPRINIAPVLYAPAAIMNKLQAQELFTSKDNLAYRLADNATELPQQVWFDDRPTPLASSQRITDGFDNDHDGMTYEPDEAFVKRIGFGDFARLGATEFSWLATITPDRTYKVNRKGEGAGLDITDQYLVSIVVFHNRVLTMDITTSKHRERLLQVTLRGSGTGGGEVRLQSNNIVDLDLKHGDWVMLSALSSLGPHFRWYKITFIDDEVRTDSRGIFYRDATLQGPDWNRAEWLGPSPQYRTHATFVPHVIGVFEKTIRIETTSLY